MLISAQDDTRGSTDGNTPAIGSRHAARATPKARSAFLVPFPVHENVSFYGKAVLEMCLVQKNTYFNGLRLLCRTPRSKIDHETTEVCDKCLILLII